MAPTVPTPGQWLSELLTSSGISHAALARQIGRSRAEVTRWTSGREQMPRMHLAEVADQFGSPDALDYVMRLKDCEDAQDQLLRWSSRLAKRVGTSSPTVGDTLLVSVDALANPVLSGIAAAQDRMRLLTVAKFAVTQWALFAEGDNEDLFTPESIGRHLRYPLNHFMGTLLQDASPAPSAILITRALGLANLRKLVKAEGVAERIPLIHHHAIHMLARYGEDNDRATVSDLIIQGVNSEDRLSRKLGFSGLIMAQGTDSEISDKFLYELTRDPELAAVDLAFDATHYGDLNLDAAGQLRPLDRLAPMLLKSIAKHYTLPQVYGRQADIDAFRALSALRFGRPTEITAEVQSALISCIRSGAIDSSTGTFQRMLYQELSHLPGLQAATLPTAKATEPDVNGTPEPATRHPEYDLFISYSRSDQDFVRQLDRSLTSNGLRCWVDFRDMPLGRPVQESMQDGLESSKAFLFVLGATSGRWQIVELRGAIEDSVEKGKWVIPFVISGTAIPQSAPAFLRQFHGIFLDNYATLDEACMTIATSLRALAGRNW